jgi:hypothetical protein
MKLFRANTINFYCQNDCKGYRLFWLGTEAGCLHKYLRSKGEPAARLVIGKEEFGEGLGVRIDEITALFWPWRSVSQVVIKDKLVDNCFQLLPIESL